MKTSFKCSILAAGILLSGLASQAAVTGDPVNPCLPAATIAALPNSYGCFSFTVTNSGQVYPYNYYSWDFGDGTTGTGRYLYHCYNPVTSTTIRTVTVFFNSPQLCGPLPNFQVYTLTLNPPPSTLCVTQTPSITLAPPSVTVWTGAAIPEMIFTFNYGDGTQPTTSSTHNYAACNNYLIEVQSWDMNSPQNVCYSYAAVNMNCDSGIVSEVIEIPEARTYTLWPSPAESFIKVAGSAIISGLSITDLAGKTLLIWEALDTKTACIPLDGLESGIYIVHIRGTDNREINFKFIRH